MQDEKLTGNESLQVIHAMINKAKNQFSENGHLYLLWGWFVLICSITHFILLHFLHYEKAYLIWMLTCVVLIYQIVYLRRRGKKTKVTTYTDDIIKFVWLVFVILMFLFYFLYIRVLERDFFKFISPGFLALYGMPTFLSGVILRFRPLVIGGISCWILSGISTYIGYDYQLLLLALAVIVAWIIPGYILGSRFKKVNN